MNWDDLRVVSAIYKAGSFARAAQALHLDETTIGRRLARIEAALGRPPALPSNSGHRWSCRTGPSSQNPLPSPCRGCRAQPMLNRPGQRRSSCCFRLRGHA
ncbi:helix-turn-helix domain-containing protein [Paracoccus sphaerophysae]|uniref:helix-turn-helix domain-containing protein n=1 Tax=Paracoccus sphaerophysae TaxID=690417 RepID=UPI000A04076B|nr:LysR family transcriptional regulator [Paracoccus sphaerophysae]